MSTKIIKQEKNKASPKIIIEDQYEAVPPKNMNEISLNELQKEKKRNNLNFREFDTATKLRNEFNSFNKEKKLKYKESREKKIRSCPLYELICSSKPIFEQAKTKTKIYKNHNLKSEEGTFKSEVAKFNRISREETKPRKNLKFINGAKF